MKSDPEPPHPFRGLTVERLESFLAVADAGGIAKAAPGNPSRQSQLSRQLREVSAALGFEVFERQGNSLVLTDAGVRVRALLRELIVGLETLRSDHAKTRVPATLVAGDSVLRWLVLPLLHDVLMQDDAVELSVRAVQHGLEVILQGDADFSISRRRPTKPAGIASTRLGTLRYALFAPRTLCTPDMSAALLSKLPFVYVTGASDVMAAFLELLPAAPTIALRCETFPQGALAVASGQYAAVLPELAAHDLDMRVTTQVALRGLEKLDLHLVLVARERRLDAVPALRRTYDGLAKRLKQTLDGNR